MNHNVSTANSSISHAHDVIGSPSCQLTATQLTSLIGLESKGVLNEFAPEGEYGQQCEKYRKVEKLHQGDLKVLRDVVSDVKNTNFHMKKGVLRKAGFSDKKLKQCVQYEKELFRYYTESGVNYGGVFTMKMKVISGLTQVKRDAFQKYEDALNRKISRYTQNLDRLDSKILLNNVEGDLVEGQGFLRIFQTMYAASVEIVRQLMDLPTCIVDALKEQESYKEMIDLNTALNPDFPESVMPTLNDTSCAKLARDIPGLAAQMNETIAAANNLSR